MVLDVKYIMHGNELKHGGHKAVSLREQHVFQCNVQLADTLINVSESHDVGLLVVDVNGFSSGSADLSRE